MKRWAWMLAVCAVAYAQENVSITWIGQAGFILKSANGPTVVTDPPAASVGYTIPAVSADAVTITHNHSDHNFSGGVGGSFTLVDGRPVTTRQEMNVAGIPFLLIPGFHDNTNGSTRGANTIIRWTQSGMRMAHFGDLGQEQLTAAQLADLTNLDVLFIPAGGFFTVSPERAAQYVSELRPRVAILMHYKTALGGPAQLAGLPAVATAFSSAAPVVYQPSTVTVSASTLPRATQVWIMLPRADAAVVNSASFAAGQPVAPGSLVSVFGSFPGAAAGQAQSYPLPRTFDDTEVLVDGKAAPLYYSSPAQINFQMPSATASGQFVTEVRVGGQPVARSAATVLPAAPGLFTAANQDGSINSASRPSRPGDTIVLYGTGQGAVSPPVEDGAAATVLSASTVMPIVYLGGRQMQVAFSGLAPGFAGLWQINVALPPDVPTGNEMELTVVSGLASNKLDISVRRE